MLRVNNTNTRMTSRLMIHKRVKFLNYHRCTERKRFSVNHFFLVNVENLKFPADLLRFTKETNNGKFRILCGTSGPDG